MNLDDLLPLLSSLALAALGSVVREYGLALIGDDYAYLSGSVAEQLDDLIMYIS